MPMRRWGLVALGFCAFFASVPAGAAAVLFSAAGPDAASIQPVVDAFRTPLGADNGTTTGSQPTGRREINWDSGGAGAPATPYPSPMPLFAKRGSVFSTPGTGFEISGQPLPEFGNINPTYPSIFATFSSPSLFAAVGSNIIDVRFTVPGTTNQPALSRGFGAVFTDVDLASTTSLAFYDPLNNLLGLFYASPFDNGLSFLGALFDTAIVARVRITSGNVALGPNDGVGTDVVALDNFIYGEPQRVPEPAAVLLLFGAAEHKPRQSAWPLYSRGADVAAP